MVRRTAAHLLFAICLLPAIAFAGKPPADPCRGSALSLDRIERRCLIKGAAADSRRPEALHLELSVPRPWIKPGEATNLTVRMTNTGSDPLELNLGCSGFEATALALPISQEPPTVPPAECRKQVRVTLEPHGTLMKTLRFTARAHGKPLALGLYRLRVSTPFLMPDAQRPELSKRIAMDAQISVRE